MRGFDSSVLLVRCLIQQVLFQGLLRVLDLLMLGWERPWDHILFLDLLRIMLNSSVDLGVKFTFFSHLLQGLMLVGPDRVLECKLSSTLNSYKIMFTYNITIERGVLHFDGVLTGRGLPVSTIA